MGHSTLAELRDAYVDAFNRGAMDELEELLHDDASYVWVAAGGSTDGREAVMGLYRKGHEAFGGKSRLTVVEGTDDQAIWWQPRCDALQAAGLQTVTMKEGKLLAINDEHAPEKLEPLVRGLEPPALDGPGICDPVRIDERQE